MIKITKALAAHAAEHLGLDSSLASDVKANEDAIRKCVSEALVSGKISVKQLEELTAEPAVEDAAAKAKAMMNEAVAEAVSPLAKGLEDLTITLTKAFAAKPAEEPQGQGEGAGAKAYQAAGEQAGQKEVEGKVRVKAVTELYDGTKRMAMQPGTEKAISVPGGDGIPDRVLYEPSQFDKAVSGAWLKFMINRQATADNHTVPNGLKMTDHDWALVKHAVHEMPFVGPVGMKGEDEEVGTAGWAKSMRLSDMQQKTLLDDATSGGLEAVPIVFDDIAILTPLLTGELFPFVTVRTTTRRRVEGFSMANPDVYWTAEGTTPSVFDTADFIAAFDTNVHPCTGTMEVGLDFESDSPVAIADLLIGRYGEVMRKELDDVIATGSGSGRPLGIFNTVGITALTTANGTGGPWTVGDLDKLYYGVDAAFRQEAGNRLCFVGNDTTYQRLRSIQVGTSDQRRVLGMSYLGQGQPMINDVRYCRNSTIDNAALGAVCLNRYIMYRRAGFSVRRETGGTTLAAKNLAQYIFRMRIGGQLNHSSAAVVYDTSGQT